MADAFFQQAVELIESYRAAGCYPDAAYAVFTRDEILLRGACGEADANTWFDFASLSKLFTTTAVLLLAEQGAFALADTLAPLLPQTAEYPVLQQRLGEITLTQLLTHTSGLLPWYPFYTQGGPFYPLLAKVLAENPAQSGMRYSDLNFILLGKLVEQATGLPLPQALVQLGLSTQQQGPLYFTKDTPVPARLRGPGRIAIGCFGNGVEEKMCADRGLAFDGFRSKWQPVTGQANDGNCWYYFGGVSGHAGLFGPADALVALGRRYLCAQSGLLVQAMQDVGVGRGLGFECDAKYPDGCGHTGFTGTSLWLSPVHGVGMALLTNRLAVPGQTAAPDLTVCRTQVHEAVLRAFLARQAKGE